MAMHALIVGLSGITNGGKSTLAKHLMKVLPSGTKLVKQDDYFLPTDSPLHVPSPGGINHHNWDVISSVDMDQMVKDLKLISSRIDANRKADKITQYSPSLDDDVEFSVDLDLASVEKDLSLLRECEQRRGIILVDGFTLFDDPRLRELCHLQFFLTLPKRECFQRRQMRHYDPPDPDGYFDACVWPMYEAHLERVQQCAGVKFYDGTLRIENIFVAVLNKIVAAAIS